MCRKLKIVDLLGKFNLLEQSLAEFQCRSCFSSFGAHLPSDYRLSVQLVTDDVSLLVALARDFLAHLPGLEDPEQNEHLLETHRCQCFGQLEDRLRQVVRELEDLFECYPRAFGLNKLDTRRSSPRQSPSNESESSKSSWCSWDDDQEERERELAEQRKRAREFFEDKYQSASQHILFVSHVLRRCVKQHRYLASHVLCKRQSCGNCCFGSTHNGPGPQ